MNLRESIKHNLRSFILSENENDDSLKLKYYAFDWDDNIVKMPTKIILVDENGSDVGMTTEDFAEYRHIIGKKPFEYNGKVVVDYGDNPFKFFGEFGDKRFIIDSLLAEPGPSWNDFVECINSGSIFAIITARGHTPSVLKDSVFNFIMSNHNGIDSNLLFENLKKFKKLSGKGFKEKRKLINDYLNMCKYHPVTYRTGSASSPEEGKISALKEFITYVKELSSKLKVPALFKNDVKNYFIPSIGFSDDDPKNIEHIKSFLDKEYGDENKTVKTYLTKGDIKKEV